MQIEALRTVARSDSGCFYLCTTKSCKPVCKPSKAEDSPSRVRVITGRSFMTPSYHPITCVAAIQYGYKYPALVDILCYLLTCVLSSFAWISV